MKKFLNIVEQDKPIRQEIDEAIKRVLDSGQFILGEEVKAFEKELAEFCGVKYAIAVNSGTDALYLSCNLLEREKEVITTPFTFIATTEAIVRAGLRPVFVDIGEDKLIDDSKIERIITKDTKAILPVHLFGKSCNMDKIMELADKYDLTVIEDAAQAFGAPLRGDMACLSFYPTKIFGAYGDGGMVITNKEWIADRIRLLRNHGSSPKDKYLNLIIGTNSRLDEIQAAILRIKLKHFNPKGFSYDKTKYYPRPLHLQPCFRYLGYHRGDFPMAEKASQDILTLRLQHGL